jgi:hypothetical protein
MHRHPRRLHRIGLTSTLAVFLLGTSAAYGDVGALRPAPVIELAQAGGTEPRELEPRYEPVQPEEPSWYNSSYIFGMTRSVAHSTMVPAAKVPLFVLTVPLDIVFLPFAAIGGLFG